MTRSAILGKVPPGPKRPAKELEVRFCDKTIEARNPLQLRRLRKRYCKDCEKKRAESMAADKAADEARKAANRKRAAERKGREEEATKKRKSLYEDLWGVEKPATVKNTRGMTTAERQELTIKQALLDARYRR